MQRYWKEIESGGLRREAVQQPIVISCMQRGKCFENLTFTGTTPLLRMERYYICGCTVWTVVTFMCPKASAGNKRVVVKPDLELATRAADGVVLRISIGSLYSRQSDSHSTNHKLAHKTSNAILLVQRHAYSYMQFI